MHDEEEPYALCSSQNRIRLIKSKRMQDRQCTVRTTVKRVRAIMVAVERLYVLHITTVRLTFLTHSVRMRPNFQGLPWLQCDGLGEDELLITFLLNW